MHLKIIFFSRKKMCAYFFQNFQTRLPETHLFFYLALLIIAF